MKVATVRYQGNVFAGVLKDDSFTAFQAIDAHLPNDMIRFIEGYGEYQDLVAQGLPAAEPTCSVSEAEFLSPLPQPRTFRDFLSFEEHTVNCGKAFKASEEMTEKLLAVWRSFPGFYFSNPNVFYGADEPITMHPTSQMFDCEFEIGIVIGKQGKDIPADDANDYIFGLTILNDWSARDIQAKEAALQLGPAKGKDYANSMGPCIVTMDEIRQYAVEGDPKRFDMPTKLYRNGELLRENNTNTIYHTYADLIAYASRATAVYPGEVLGSGTIGGGAMLEYLGAQPFVHAGDVFEMEIEGIGKLRIEVV